MWTAARRALTILRDQGPVVLGWKALGELGYRRAILFERPLDKQPAVARPSPPVELGTLGERDAEEYLSFHPEASRPEFERRLAAGDWCFVARANGRIVGVRWVSRREGRVAYLGLAFPLAEGEAFVYDIFTDPAWRGRGVARALFWHMDARLRPERFTKVLSAAVRENWQGVDFTASTSIPTATLVSVGFGNRRRHWRRPPPA